MPFQIWCTYRTIQIYMCDQLVGCCSNAYLLTQWTRRYQTASDKKEHEAEAEWNLTVTGLGDSFTVQRLKMLDGCLVVLWILGGQNFLFINPELVELAISSNVPSVGLGDFLQLGLFFTWLETTPDFPFSHVSELVFEVQSWTYFEIASPQLFVIKWWVIHFIISFSFRTGHYQITDVARRSLMLFQQEFSEDSTAITPQQLGSCLFMPQQHVWTFPQQGYAMEGRFWGRI